MRQKRAKTYRKLMALYSSSFGFRQPYQVLVDPEICIQAVEAKLDVVKQLSTVLQGDVKTMITQCCIHQLYLKGSTHQAAVDLAKTFERRKCNHREAIPADDCLASVIGIDNKHRYVVATQSQALRSRLRSIPAVPIIHFNRSVMILEPLSNTTSNAKTLIDESALHASSSENVASKTTNAMEPPRKKRKGPKEPNPLSVKRRRPAPPQSNPKKRSRYEVLVDEIPSELEEGDKQILKEHLQRHPDFDVSNIAAPGDWSELAQTIRKGGTTRRKRKRKAIPQESNVD